MTVDGAGQAVTVDFWLGRLAELGRRQGLAIGTIRNDDATVSIAAQSAVQAEGNSGQ